MTTVLGLIGSARKWGNSEVLARQALLGAQEAGAETKMLRLTDLHVEPCTGCMRCAIRSEPCPLDDDMFTLIDRLRAADAAVLAAPTYILGPPGAVKLVLDRMLMLVPDLDELVQQSKPGLALSVSGLRPWRGTALPFLVTLLQGFGFTRVHSVACYTPGPGEVLLDDELMARVHDLGRQLVTGGGAPQIPEANVCPVCHSDFFTLSADRATCPMCGLQARIEHTADGIRLAFDDPTGYEGHWTPRGMRQFVEGWIIPSGERFLAHRQEIKARRARLES